MKIEYEKMTVRALRITNIIFPITVMLLVIIRSSLGFGYPNVGASILSLAELFICIVQMTLYLIFPKYCSLGSAFRERKKCYSGRDRRYDKTHVDIFFSILISVVFASCSATSMDCMLVSRAVILVCGVAIAAAMLPIYFICSSEHRELNLIAPIIIFFLAVFVVSSSAAYALNCLPSEQTAHYQSVVTDKRYEIGGNFGGSFKLSVPLSDGKTVSLSVSEKEYDSMEIGDAVDVEEYRGWLFQRIAVVDINEE